MADQITLTVTIKGAIKSGRLAINDLAVPLTGSGSSFKATVKLNATAKRVKIAWAVRGTNGTKVELVAKARGKEILSASDDIKGGAWGDEKTVNIPEANA